MKPLWSAEQMGSAIRIVCEFNVPTGRAAGIADWVSAQEWRYAAGVERRYILTASIHRMNRKIEVLNNENRA